MKHLAMCGAAWALLSGSLFSVHAAAQSPVASYYFDNSLNAVQSGVASLLSVDPLQGQAGRGNAFFADTVFGQSRPVFHWDGNLPFEEEAGLKLNTTGLLPTQNYSVEMVFEFTENKSNDGWRRLLDVSDRTSDNGLYVDAPDPDEFPNLTTSLDIWNGTANSGVTTVTDNVYHHLVLTTDGNEAKAYLDGTLELTLSPTVFNLDDPNNPDHLMQFFLDNASDGDDEFSDGNIALLRLYDTALTSDQVTTLAASPFSVPEPGSLTYLLGFSLPGAALLLKRLRRATGA